MAAILPFISPHRKGWKAMTQQGAISIADAIELYHLDNKARRLATSTQASCVNKLAIFERWCNATGVTDLDKLAPIHIRKYLIHLQDLDLSNRYEINLAKTVKTFLNYCVRDELIAVSPFAKVKIPKQEKKILPSFTDEDVNRLFDACRSLRDLLICHTLLDSGVRASELVALNFEDIDAAGTVNVKLGKGAKDRITYVGVKTLKMLTRYHIQRGKPAGKEAIFISQNSGERLTVYGLAQVMERLRDATKVDICTCHTFRRTFAISCLRNGMNIYVLARLMGHVDIVILKQYLDLIADDLKASHQRYGVIDNMQTPHSSRSKIKRH